MGTQQRLVHGFQTIYFPILGSDETSSVHEPLATPSSIMERTTKLQDAYVELRTDLLDEVDMIETRLIKPAMEAKDWIQPLKKVIKKRGDKKVRISMEQNLLVRANICSWISRSIKRGLITRERRRIDQNEIMPL